jgi:hypothetical protein
MLLKNSLDEGDRLQPVRLNVKMNRLQMGYCLGQRINALRGYSLLFTAVSFSAACLALGFLDRR